MFTRLRSLVIIFVLVAFVSGCTISREMDSPVADRQGVYHKVRKGETLWRIAKTYQVSIDEIIHSNNIPNVAYVEENQLVFIPGAEEAIEIAAAPEGPKQLDFNQDGFDWPLRGKIINYFGGTHRGYLKKGISIRAQPGQTVVASRQGRVVFSDYLSGYDYTVILDHADGYLSVYSHNDELLAELGDDVLRGDKIAQVADQGQGSFLHFEIRKDGEAANPLYFLPKL